MPKTKILFILHLPPPIHGAAVMGRYIKESTTVNESFDATYINLTASLEIQKIGRGSIGKIWIVCKIVVQVLRKLLRKRYDLCYMTLSTSGIGFYKDVLIIAITKLFNVRMVYHFHNKGIGNNGKTILNQKLKKFVFTKAKSILLSERLYSDIQKYVPPKNVYYCPNGTPDSKGSIAINTNKSEDDRFRFLFLSNLMPEKGMMVLLEACHRLVQQGCVFECHFVGAWSGMDKNFFYTEIGRLGLTEIVFVHGPKYGIEKSRFFTSSNAFVFPTLNDVFGLVNIEAMQHGIPVIASSDGGIPDIIVDGETGFLVPRGDAQILSGKMKLLLNDPDRCRRMGLASRKRYEKYYTLEIFENRITDILTNIATCK